MEQDFVRFYLQKNFDDKGWDDSAFEDIVVPKLFPLIADGALPTHKEMAAIKRGICV